MRYYLEPYGYGSEFLSKIYFNSPSVEDSWTVPPHESFILGRNEFTGLGDTACPNYQYVSRRHVQVNYRFGKVYILPMASQVGVVYVNGAPSENVETELRVNEFFSMLGIKQFYNYILKTESDASKPTTASQPQIVNLLNTSDATIGHGYDIPVSVKSASSSGGSSSNDNPSDQDNRLTLSQNQSSQLHAAVRTQSLGKTGTSTTNLNNSVEILELDNSASDIVILSPNASTKIGAALVASPAPVQVPEVPPAPPVDHAEVERKIMKVVVSKLLRQYECSICYETLACAASLHPCGCCFCYDCIADWATENKKTGSANAEATVECPLCMASFALSNAMSNRMVDSAIREVLENLPEELAAWEERLKKGTERRRTLEASASSKSSTSSLTALAGAPPAAASATSSSRGSLAARYMEEGRRLGHRQLEVVELLDSQPTDAPHSFFLPSSLRAPPVRPTGIQAYFGAQNGAALAAPTGPSPGVQATTVHRRAAPEAASSRTMSPPTRKRGRGLHVLEEEDGEDREFKHTINNMPLAPAVAAASSSSSSGTSRRSAGTGAGGGGSGAVFDLTATTTASPPAGRRSSALLARAVQSVAPVPSAAAAPPAAAQAPYPRMEEFYCVVSTPDLQSVRRKNCTKCNKVFEASKSAVGTFQAFRIDPSQNLKPGTRMQWLQQCSTWHCFFCVADNNIARRRTAPPGVDCRTSKQPRHLWPIAFEDLDMREQLSYSELRAWQSLLNG